MRTDNLKKFATLFRANAEYERPKEWELIPEYGLNMCHCLSVPMHITLGVLFIAWLAMSGFVSVGSTTQTTDIFVCCLHVVNVDPTRRQHSVMSANILAVSVVSGNFVADTFSYT